MGAEGLDRRAFLRLSSAAAGGVLLGAAGTAGASETIRRAASQAPAGSDLGAVEHVIFLMMENRSFDHYFGTYPGVRGFDDHPPSRLGPFSQAVPEAAGGLPGHLLPFRFDTVGTANAECTFDLTHNWGPQHQSWNGGRMDRFVAVHTQPQNEGPANGPLTMAYYTRQDLPYYYALADHFTIGDAYHCSVMGPTDPNRMMQMSGTIDPAGRDGGPIVTTASSGKILFTCTWETVPEILEAHGISWKYYRPPGSLFTIEPMHGVGITYDTVLPYFANYEDPSSVLYQKAFNPIYPDEFSADLDAGQLPQVSWISAPPGYDDHPPGPPALGMWFVDQLLTKLLAHPKVWARTVVFLMYDENDGFFDHVAPPVPPAGTTGEFLSVDPLPEGAAGIAGPIGLGFRVPLLVLSPFSRGGYVCSDTFDHTSQLKFLEERFGIKVPHLSAWRRRTVGDLTTTLQLDHPVTAPPKLPTTSMALPSGCVATDLFEINISRPAYPIPDPQKMPVQEPGRARRRPGK